MTESPIFMSMPASQLQTNLVQLLCRTARDKGRIEVTDCDGGSCVMISKDELESLERALEILSDTTAGKAMHSAVEQFATMTARAVPAGV